MEAKLIPIIISGGAGTRLWPWSRKLLPKPFVPLFKENLFEQTVKRLAPWGPPVIVTNQELLHITEHSLKQLNVNAAILGEPTARNTLPAIMWGCLEILKHYPSSTIVGVFPADHSIPDHSQFQQTVQQAISLAEQGFMVVIGIPPRAPETGYGYIEKGPPLLNSGGFQVHKFHEKPSKEKAVEYVQRGFFWNAGIFIFSIETLLTHCQVHQKAIFDLMSQLEKQNQNIKDIYQLLPDLSIDYGIMEKIDPKNIAVVPASFSWSDVGSWDALAELPDSIKTQFISHQASGNCVFGLEHKTYCILGANDLIVTDNEDALLITKKGFSHQTSQIYRQVKEINPHLTERHRKEQRPWGDFQVLKEGEGYKAKLITVLPKSQLSYQSHEHRGEHWVVVQGSGEVIIDDKVHPLKYGDSIFIAPKQKHRLRNPGIEILKIVEVQIGDYLGEDDIKRYDDSYGRV
ncbi:MAG: mannose-1-phosphate guanylyltransferase/mannose-6-phosphate isomerase [Bdellovibrionaceae bacterium]|nr:mannose-1-phosphate guanylyltransferase/mannose-6-phosphate isomerase [Pseudobdellovibrionaceae bacterium]MDW8189791.1 mannose-1-phosphate guanylyltransferase/mannose-6-phosphate isomerase [Pseudobdellovibrionaceae bacterium]